MFEGISHMFNAYRRKKRDKLRKAEAIAAKSRMLGLHYQALALNQTQQGTGNNNPLQLVVSLTSFRKRIDDVYLTIESLFQQSQKADKVVLWLSKEEFTWDDIPSILRKQCSRGLEIEFCDRDLGPFKKIAYALEKYPNSLILTVDDDIMYPLDMIDQLYRAYLQQPEVIYFHRGHEIQLDNNGRVAPYKQWRWNAKSLTPSLAAFPTGSGGVLYFPNCFDKEVLNKDAYMRLCPTADDVWLKAMSLKKGTKCKKINDDRDWAMRFVVVEGSQVFSLKRKNKDKESGNDAQIKAVFDAYELYNLF